MSTSTSTRTYTVQEGNTLKTVTETTVTKPDGSKSTTREEKTETVSGGRNQTFPKGTSDMEKRFNAMNIQPGKPSSFSKSATQTPTSSGGVAASTGPTDVPLKDFRQQSLKAHNERRSKHGAPALKLSDDLNDYAQKWADHLASSGSFRHSDCTLKGDRLGENIANKWSSAPTDYTGEEATQQWYSEISKHDYKSENPMGTGHFTQVVWKDSTELGMGKAKSKDGKVIVVGSYRPAGNMLGSFTKNVFPPK